MLPRRNAAVGAIRGSRQLSTLQWLRQILLDSRGIGLEVKGAPRRGPLTSPDLFESRSPSERA